MKFRFFSNCKIVKGASRSTLCDLQSEKYIFLPNELVELVDNETINVTLLKNELDEEDFLELEKFLMYLEENNFIFREEPGMENMFPVMSDQFHFPGEISNSIIELSNDNVSDLFKNNIFEQLLFLGCRNIELRILNPEIITKLLPELRANLFNEFLSVDIFVQKQTADLNFDSTKRFLSNHRNIRSLIVFNPVKTQVISSKFRGFGGLALVKGSIDSKNCGFITPDFFNMNIQTYTESLKFNSCLNKKMGIDKNGLIKNCPSCQLDFGHISTTKLSDVALKNSEFRKYFDIHKDQIKVCRDCEFRRICTDCRVFLTDNSDLYSKPLKCKYDPYTTIWEK